MSDVKDTNSGTCPHCHAPVDPLRAPAVSVVGGRIVHFCSAECRERHLERAAPPPTAQGFETSGSQGAPPPEKEQPEPRVESEQPPFLNPKSKGEIADPGGEENTGSVSPGGKPKLLKKIGSPLLRHHLLLFGMAVCVGIVALWSHEAGNPFAGQVAVALSSSAMIILGTIRQRRSGWARILESSAAPLAAVATALSHGVGAGGASLTSVFAAAILVVNQLGRTLELLGRTRSQILPALEGRCDVSIPGSWKDNSPTARKLRWMTVPLEWSRYPAAVAVGLGMFFLTNTGLPDAIIAGAIALVGLSPRGLKMATGDAHLRVALRNLAAGVFMRDAHVVDKVADCTTVTLMANDAVFDGDPRAMDLKLAEGTDKSSVLSSLCALNAEAPGRIAAGIRHWLLELGIEASQETRLIERLPGLGLRGELSGRKILSGDRRLLLSHHISTAPLEGHAHRIEQTGRRAVFVSLDDTAVACFSLEDPISIHAAPAIAAIRALGLEPILVTSLGVDAGVALAARLGIEIVEFDKQDTDVGAVVRRLEQSGDKAVLVGKGHAFEDEASTSAAAIALGHREQSGAGIVTPDENISKLPFILASCRRARSSVTTNIVVACCSLGLGIILALGWVYPASVVVAASLSSASEAFSTINGPYPGVRRLLSLPSKWIAQLKRPEATSD